MVDDIEEYGVGLVHVDGIQNEGILCEAILLENPLHFKTTSTGSVVGKYVKDYPHVPLDWYINTTKQSHMTEAD